jgi:hypothetical protein
MSRTLPLFCPSHLKSYLITSRFLHRVRENKKYFLNILVAMYSLPVQEFFFFFFFVCVSNMDKILISNHLIPSTISYFRRGLMYEKSPPLI